MLFFLYSAFIIPSMIYTCTCVKYTHTGMNQNDAITVKNKRLLLTEINKEKELIHSNLKDIIRENEGAG